MFFKLSAKIKLLLLTIFFISIFNVVFADKPVEIDYSADSPDGTARIGSQINVRISFTSDVANTTAQVVFADGVTPGLNTLALTNVGTTFTATGNYTVVAGNTDGNVSVTFHMINASGTKSVSTSCPMDNKPPTRDGIMTCKVNGSNYVAGTILKAGDNVELTQKVKDTDITRVSVDLSPIGRSSSENMVETGNNTKIYRTSFTVDSNYEVVLPCNVTLLDDVGNQTEYKDSETLNLTIDSRGPTFNATVSNNAGNVVAVPGHTLTFTATVSNYDADKPLKARMISVCGHTHTKNWDSDLDKGLIFHAELDTHSCYPWRIETIIEYIKNYLKNKGEKV